MEASKGTGVVYPDPRTVTASEVLAGLRGIVEREQMDHAGYVSHEIDKSLRESGALCRGHRACAVGATWLAGGIEPVVTRSRYGYAEVTLPGAQLDHVDRIAWLKGEGYPGLLAAYEALCAAAQEYMDARNLHVDLAAWSGRGALEGLFETERADGFLIEPRDMLVVIDRAEELVANAAA